MSKTFKSLMEWSNVMHPALQKFLKSKGLDPRYVSRNQMISHSKTGDFSKWKKYHYDKARMTHGMESVEVEELDILEEIAVVVESNTRKQQMSRSARMIKSLYKHHGVSEDKDITTYGTQPKLITTSKKSSLGEKKPKAGAILSGGTTLTGEKRDDVEFDPKVQMTNGIMNTIQTKKSK